MEDHFKIPLGFLATISALFTNSLRGLCWEALGH